jgi:hypothetical protein
MGTDRGPSRLPLVKRRQFKIAALLPLSQADHAHELVEKSRVSGQGTRPDPAHQP